MSSGADWAVGVKIKNTLDPGIVSCFNIQAAVAYIITAIRKKRVFLYKV